MEQSVTSDMNMNVLSKLDQPESGFNVLNVTHKLIHTDISFRI